MSSLATVLLSPFQIISGLDLSTYIYSIYYVYLLYLNRRFSLQDFPGLSWSHVIIVNKKSCMPSLLWFCRFSVPACACLPFLLPCMRILTVSPSRLPAHANCRTKSLYGETAHHYSLIDSQFIRSIWGSWSSDLLAMGWMRDAAATQS